MYAYVRLYTRIGAQARRAVRAADVEALRVRHCDGLLPQLRDHAGQRPAAAVP